MDEENLDKPRVKFVRDHAKRAFCQCEHLFSQGFPTDLEATLNIILPGYQIFEIELPTGISGITRKIEKLIGINKKHALVRKRFSIAHEMGHILLIHPDILPAENPKVFETEANMFAGEFLVPTKTLREQFKTCRDPNLLAKYFNVSRDVLFIRLKDTT